MQSAPKRWREHLTSTGVEGAFRKWKVALLFDKGHKQREAFVRVLKAGHAIICNPEELHEEVTHVFLSNHLKANREKQHFDEPYYSVQYLGTYLLEDPIEGASEEITFEQVDDIKHMIWKRFCLAQARHHCCIKRHIMLNKNGQVNSFDNGRSSVNRIEGLIDGQFFTEAFGELEYLLPTLPPVHVFQLLMKNLLQGNLDITCFGRFFDIFNNLLWFHPPWESTRMVQYYLDFLQCPLCQRGCWPFIEVLARSFLNERLSLCHSSSDLGNEPSNMDINKRVVAALLLKYVANIIQEEAKVLSKRLCECPGFVQRALLPSFTVRIFWSELRTMKLLTRQLSSLTDLVLKFHKAVCHTDDVLVEEVASSLNIMLSSAVEYWILLGFYLNKNLIYQVSNDLAFFMCVPCEDFSMEEKEKFISSIASPWLQMLVAEVIFINLCVKCNVNITSDPLSLEKLISTYIPALWKVGTCGKEVQKLKGKRKIGQQLCLESQKALLMLNGENNYQGDVLLDLPILPKLRRKSECPAVFAKENLPLSDQDQSFNRHNTKGETPLHTACGNNKVKKLIVLLSLPGTDINVKDHAGWTPLHEACNHGNTECVRVILQQCPEVNLLSHVDGVTPLHDALLNGHVEIGKMLLHYGGPTLLQQKDSYGKFPLDYIASPQLKNELFDFVQLNETIEDFHKHAALEYDSHKIEFTAFLLSKMLLNFHSLYDLPANSHAAKTLCPNAALFINHIRSKETKVTFASAFVEGYIENVVTLQKLSDLPQAVPDALVAHTAGIHLKILLAAIHTLASQSFTIEKK
ncbi:SMC5-SMC6 complex localization factor protein 1 isoform X2 [Xenopus laevis]|nr:SMC5-SMC6 complex localization factor protein 1 isoform X2 [Xenopus laevis]